MNFQRVDANSHYRSLRFVSTEGNWELGLSPYHHGMRIRMGRNGGVPKVLDACLGRDETIYGAVLLALIRKLEAVSEGVTSCELSRIFPWQGTSPNLAIFLNALLTDSESVREEDFIAKNLH